MFIHKVDVYYFGRGTGKIYYFCGLLVQLNQNWNYKIMSTINSKSRITHA